MPSQHSDYILRIIEQLGAAIRRIRDLLTRSSPVPEEALTELRAARGTLLGARAAVLEELDAESAVALLGDTRPLELWITLLRLEADAWDQLGDAVRASRCRQRASDLETAGRDAAQREA